MIPERRRRPVQAIQVDMVCNLGECYEVPLKSAGVCRPMNPPEYLHVCPVCGTKYYLDAQYPKIEWGEIEGA